MDQGGVKRQQTSTCNALHVLSSIPVADEVSLQCDLTRVAAAASTDCTHGPENLRGTSGCDISNALKPPNLNAQQHVKLHFPGSR